MRSGKKMRRNDEVDTCSIVEKGIIGDYVRELLQVKVPARTQSYSGMRMMSKIIQSNTEFAGWLVLFVLKICQGAVRVESTKRLARFGSHVAPSMVML